MDKVVKKVTGVRLDPNLVKELKILAVHHDRSLTSLLEEAAKMLLEKYKSKGE